MAVRLEKAFGADRKRLLEMQAAYNRRERHAGEKDVAVRAFVPTFLTITARQIEDWADSQIDARTHLPVLLRRLVHSTGSDLSQVDFPGFDNAQRKGSDGLVEAGAATPWVPEGKSYWEFGTDKRPAAKAERDYSARLSSVGPAERAISTFVFVTSRNWPGKSTWESQKNEAGDWKAVRAFDASDLEQWLEQSVPVQIWLAEQLAPPVSGCETLQQAWRRWANASEPHLTPEIFAPSITAYRDTFKTWLDKPSDKPFIVAADSRDEALAFLACSTMTISGNSEILRQSSHRRRRSERSLPLPYLSSRSFIPKTPSANSPMPIADFTALSSVLAMQSIRKPTSRSTCLATTPSRRRSLPSESMKARSTGSQESPAGRRQSFAAASRGIRQFRRRHGLATTIRQRQLCRWR